MDERAILPSLGSPALAVSFQWEPWRAGRRSAKLREKFLQYNHVLFTHRQLPLNRITPNRLFIARLVLVYSFARCRNPAHFHATNKVRQCIVLLRAFLAVWDHAHQMASLIFEFHTLTLTCQPLHLQPPKIGETWLLTLQKGLFELLR